MRGNLKKKWKKVSILVLFFKTPKTILSIKIAFYGIGGVGKSSLIFQFLENKFVSCNNFSYSFPLLKKK